MDAPKTLQKAIEYFADPQRCFDYAVKLRWPGGKVVCPRCDSDRNYFIKTRRVWLCRGCNKQFTLKVGTIFEDSPLGMDKWMSAFWMLCNCKNGVSSMEIHRALGITQKSAWFMLHRLRAALKAKTLIMKMGGDNSQVEVDETFIGGKVQNMHRARRIKFQHESGNAGTGGKAIVQGILDRNTKQVRAMVVPNIKRETLQENVFRNIRFGSTVYSDSAVAYDKLWRGYSHSVINHAIRYVSGQIHTNGVENFWSLLKRGLKGTYISVEPFHLEKYVVEQVFRYNHRATKDNPLNDSDRFTYAMSQVGGKRLTYSELTGKDQSPRHETTGAGEAPVPF
jgi:transposase-like protein